MAQLTTEERNGLHDAMLQAFPDRADLDQLLRLNLGESLPSVAPQGTTQRVAILDLITWFEAHGRITELVAAVHRARSRNILVTTITQAIRARLGDAEPMAVAQGPAPRQGLEAADRQHPRRGGRWMAIGVGVILFVAAAAAIISPAIRRLVWNTRTISNEAALSGPTIEVPPTIQFHLGVGTKSERDPRSLSDAGSRAWAAGDKARGTELLAEAHEAAPTDPVISYNYARCLFDQGKTDEAIKLAEGAVERLATFDEARLLLAAAALRKGNYDAAEQQLQRLIDKAGTIALTIQGTIQLFRKQPQDALASFQAALRLLDGNPNAVYNVGLANQRVGNLSVAERLYRQALAMNPAHPGARHNPSMLLQGKVVPGPVPVPTSIDGTSRNTYETARSGGAPPCQIASSLHNQPLEPPEPGPRDMRDTQFFASASKRIAGQYDRMVVANSRLAKAPATIASIITFGDGFNLGAFRIATPDWSIVSSGYYGPPEEIRSLPLCGAAPFVLHPGDACQLFLLMNPIGRSTKATVRVQVDCAGRSSLLYEFFDTRDTPE